MKELAVLIAIAAWISGAVLVKGAWLTAAALVCPIYAWYVFADHFLTLSGMK